MFKGMRMMEGLMPKQFEGCEPLFFYLYPYHAIRSVVTKKCTFILFNICLCFKANACIHMIKHRVFTECIPYAKLLRKL